MCISDTCVYFTILMKFLVPSVMDFNKYTFTCWTEVHPGNPKRTTASPTLTD